MLIFISCRVPNLKLVFDVFAVDHLIRRWMSYVHVQFLSCKTISRYRSNDFLLLIEDRYNL